MNNAGIDRAHGHGVVAAAIRFSASRRKQAIRFYCDVNPAVRWLKAHAAEFNGTTKVGAFGKLQHGHFGCSSTGCDRGIGYSAVAVAQQTEVDASLSYVIVGWPVICPLYPSASQRFKREEHIKAHIGTGRQKKRWPRQPPDDRRHDSKSNCRQYYLPWANDPNDPL
jgi:hypothetical protein